MRDHASDTTCVALLRGINVGGRNRLPMDDLAKIFRDAGCRRVQTYIQSGNVIFQAEPSLASRLPDIVPTAIADQAGLEVPVVLRSAAELEAVATGNPFLARTSDPKSLHVVFLQDFPDAQRVGTLEPKRSPPDQFELRGREVYLWCPQGIARSKLTTQYFDSRLDTIATIRNWRTVRKLMAMARATDV